MERLSVIIPIYNEENIEKNVRRVIDVLNAAGIPHEIILVDDGSKNDSWNQISDIVDKYKNVKGVAFSRNFGKESALCAGLDLCEGACAVCLDADMQFPPEVIPDMYKLWRDGYEVVEGVKRARQKESVFYKMSAGAFYSLMQRLARVDLKNASDFRLLDRTAIDAWKKMPERQTFFRGMSSWVGFKRTQYEFDVEDRVDGKSKWSLKGLIAFAIDSVTSYTAAPLYASIALGALFLVFAVIMVVQTLYMYIRGAAQGGFTTVILLQLISSAVLLLSIGIVGIYLKKIYEEVKARPRYIIRRILKREDEDNDRS